MTRTTWRPASSISPPQNTSKTGLFKVNPELLNQRYQAMLALQDEIKPFPATLRELAIKWEVTLAPAYRTIKFLLKEGLVIARRGRYYAILEAYDDQE